MKTNVEETNRNIYDIVTNNQTETTLTGLNEDTIRELSRLKDEPDWILDIRLKALKYFNELENPTWGPDLRDLDLSKITTYVKPKTKMSDKWEDVPEEIKDVFDKLGIPEAEKKSLSGASAQFDSEVVYHNVNHKLEGTGAIYLDFDSAIKKLILLKKEHISLPSFYQY